MWQRDDDPSAGKQLLFAAAMAGLCTLATGLVLLVIDHLRRATGLDGDDPGAEVDE